MKRNSVKTFWAKIHIGFYNRDTKEIVGSLKKTRAICQEYVDAVSLCVTLTPTEYIYVQGNEPGVEVGLINYPRFPEEVSLIREKAINLAEKLMIAFQQYKVSVVMPTETIMLSKEPEN